MTHPVRVLFVDDQTNVLEGIRRSLHGMRKEWQMEFAPSGQEALKFLDKNACDVLVTDMRMPGMDGAELLARVELKWPETVRIVLSGQSNREDFTRIIGLSHQYISKPCPPDAIARVIKRSLVLRDRVKSQSLQRAASALKKIPSPPESYMKLMQALRSPDANLQTVVDAIESDTGLVGRVLKLANSPYFGAMQSINTPTAAVRFLGTERIASLVLAGGMWASLEEAGVDPYLLKTVSAHASGCAATARAIALAEKLPGHEVDQCFGAALLHDMGQLVLAANLPETSAKLVAAYPNENPSRIKAEVHKFGADHATLGGYLAALWGLPDPITEAIALHHEPGAMPVTRLDVTMVVHIAEALCQADGQERYPSGLDIDRVRSLGLEHRLYAWRQLVRRG
jgi:HD-like signal output (HDOD) protein